jgi:hypothetical protein
VVKVGIPKQTHDGFMDVHALRASSVTLAAEAGANVRELQLHARHADPRLTMAVYTKARDCRRAELAKRLGGVIPDVEGAAECTWTKQYHDARKLLSGQALPLTQ